MAPLVATEARPDSTGGAGVEKPTKGADSQMNETVSHWAAARMSFERGGGLIVCDLI